MIYIKPKCFALTTAGKTNFALTGLEKPNVTQTKSRLLFAELSQSPVKVQQNGVALSPGKGAAVKGVLVALYSYLVTVVDAGCAGEGELQKCRCNLTLFNFSYVEMQCYGVP